MFGGFDVSRLELRLRRNAVLINQVIMLILRRRIGRSRFKVRQANKSSDMVG